jgi:hypothetical protein
MSSRAHSLGPLILAAAVVLAIGMSHAGLVDAVHRLVVVGVLGAILFA